MDDSFFASLGRFIHQFSIAEGTALDVLWRITGLPLDVAKTIFKSSRAEEAIDRIRDIHKGAQKPLDSSLDRALEQLQSINRLRNLIVHHGIGLTNDEGIYRTGKANVAKSFDPYVEIPVTQAGLADATEDLKTIFATFALYMMPSAVKADAMWQLAVTHLTNAAGAPWRYRYPQPTRVSATASGPHTQPPQPPAFQA